jgi:transcriptional regulator with XRE-family HTH domain
MINMSREELARRSGVSFRAISSFEQGKTKLMKLNHEAIRQALEAAGIVFIASTGIRHDPRPDKAK